ncbi:MAG: DUF932 domain-containing protein [Burkholderiales bacterium]
MSTLATRFGSNANLLRAGAPLSDDQIHAAAPSIFADHAHDSRSTRYAYIATSEVLAGLRCEGFQPFMVCQSRSRDEERREYTKHMLRLRHASQINGAEANEIILINSHDGTSAYQMLAGVFRFACHNGMVCGTEVADIRIPHKGDVTARVIEGAFRVLEDFDEITAGIEGMKALTLSEGEQQALARAALALRHDEGQPAPITEAQLLTARRFEDRAPNLWATFNRVQENTLKGGLRGRNVRGQRVTTRAINGIDSNVKLNRALWVLAEEMRKLRSN